MSKLEAKARQEIVLDIVRAKRALGYSGEQMKKVFFKDIWPSILEHLKQTGYVPPK